MFDDLLIEVWDAWETIGIAYSGKRSKELRA